ncbi:mitochondrial inner membrane protease subunit 2 isoform X4 [Bubalus bubalis]|uniref:mitochondrial inner membrane protease subunit 2 isoform X4 n=1 Tax=Bubalus bubalis TaxID=89462 RepID=UPI001E1B7024|nr:mitochondrial inner membrane protease subunit 2 isoform X4 [Bubalus bubalis]
MCACACLSEAPRGSGPCPLGPFLLPLTRGFGQIWRGHKITTYPFSPRKNGRKGMAQSQGWVRRYFKAFCKGFFVAVPVAVTFLDRVACVARVEGASMQPSLNPGGSQSSDVVLLNHWKVRNFEVQRGDIVSLVTMGHKNRYVKVPRGHIWVEGDHHGHSFDSNSFGPHQVNVAREHCFEKCRSWDAIWRISLGSDCERVLVHPCNLLSSKPWISALVLV